MADEQKLRYTVEINKAGTGAAQAARELQEVSKAAETSVKSLAAAGRELKSALAAVAGAAIIRESIQAFTEQDAAVRRLNGTLIALGRNGADTSRQLQQLAQSVTLPPGASRNSVLDAIAELTRNGAATSDLPRLTQMVMDLAAAGYGVERAADAMGNAVAGDFGKLAKILNVDFPAAAGRANNLAEALSLVQQRFGGLAAQTAGGLGGGLAEFNENLTKIKESLGQIVLTGLEPIVKELSSAAAFWAKLVSGEAPTPYERPPGSPGGPLRGSPTPKADPRALVDAAMAEQLMRQREFESLLRAARDPRARLGMAAGDSDSTQVEQRQLAALQETLEKGFVLEEFYVRQRDELVRASELRRASLATEGARESMRLSSEALGAEAQRLLEVNLQYEQRAALLRAYAFDLASVAQSEEEAINRLVAMESAMQQLRSATEIARFQASDYGRTLIDIGRQGTQAFAGGLSNAMVTAARTGKAAFGEFFSSFFAQMAQAIAQALMLRAISGILGGMGVSPGTIQAMGLPAMNAAGGFNPRMMAMGGVQTVSSATYFPRFNAVAGEAGSEVLAVLSKPRFMAIGGLQSYVGSVQGSELAMTNARDLRAAIGNRQSPIGGEIVVVVRGTKDFEARVVDSSIEGALVRVHNEVLQDTGLRSAIKEVGA